MIRTPCIMCDIVTPGDYVAYRLTTSDSELVKSFFSGTSFVYGFETSKKGVEHFHVIMLGHEHYSMVRQRIGRAKFTAASCWSKKNYKSDFIKGISYTVKSGNVFVSDDVMADYVKAAPSWVFDQAKVQTIIKQDTEARKDRDWQLTYANLVTQAVRYHQSTGKKDDVGLKTVVQEMMEHTKWRPSFHMIKNGVPPAYEEDFSFRIGKRARQSMDWWTPRF